MPHIGPYYMNKQGYKQVGSWGFDRDRLWSKINTTPDANGCHNWQGAMSPSGALMGAWKQRDGVMTQQMTQARRLVLADTTDKDISEYQVKLSCGNQQCCNPEHFILKPTNRPSTYNPGTKRKGWWSA